MADNTMFFDECPGCHSANVSDCPAACHLTSNYDGQPFSRWCQNCGLVYHPFTFTDSLLSELKDSSIREFVKDWRSTGWLSREQVDGTTRESVLEKFRSRRPVGHGSWRRFALQTKIRIAKLARDLKAQEECR